MDFFQEPIYYQNPQLCLKASIFTQPVEQNTFVPLWHYHKEVEFILVLDGVHEIDMPAHSHVLNTGDVLVIGSSQIHRPRYPANREVTYLVVHVNFEPYFDPATMNYSRHFMEMINPLEELNYIFRESSQVQSETAAILLDIHHEIATQQKGYELAISISIKQLLLTLLRNDDQERLQAYDVMDAELLRKVTDYVESHLAEKIEMSTVCQAAGMSYAYFSKYFKKKSGISFVDYVNRKRIAKAERLLAVDNKNIAEIASEIGIENMAHFYELFKRYVGCTPKQYKTRMQGSNPAHSLLDPEK
ncbi:helix-turn-helix domain-containing protein [Paenibacillus sp. strain BS8-2]